MDYFPPKNSIKDVWACGNSHKSHRSGFYKKCFMCVHYKYRGGEVVWGGKIWDHDTVDESQGGFKTEFEAVEWCQTKALEAWCRITTDAVVLLTQDKIDRKLKNKEKNLLRDVVKSMITE